MRNALALWCSLACLAAVPAQGTTTLDAAQAHTDEGQDVAALELLAGLSPSALTGAEQLRAASMLVALGQRFRAAGDLDRSVRAHAAGLDQRTALHGDHAHPDVADSASETAFLLMRLARPRDALPHCELALRVRRGG